MLKELPYQPGNPEYDRKSGLIDQISDTSADTLKVLVKIGEEFSRSSTSSNKQSSLFLDRLQKSGILPYYNHIDLLIRNGADVGSHIDNARGAIEDNFELQQLASIATYKLSGETLGVKDQMEWLVSIFNRAHQISLRENSSLSDATQEMGNKFSVHREKVYKSRTRLASKLQESTIIDGKIATSIIDSSYEEFDNTPGVDYFLLCHFWYSLKGNQDIKFIFNRLQRIMELGYYFGCSDLLKEDIRYEDRNLYYSPFSY